MDSDRFNGFVKKELGELLLNDIWGHYIFNESDLHSAAYFYIRKYFMKKDRDHCYVRCEPPLLGKKPDIVVYNRGNPEYVIELKMFRTLEWFNEEDAFKDIEKINMFATKIPSIKWGFFLAVYDCDDVYSLTNSRLRRSGINNVSFSSINIRRQQDSKRKRNGYDNWREEFDRLVGKHKAHA